jgi:hypothetical protein
VLAVYQFASPSALTQAAQQYGATTLAWPLTWTELMRACATPAAAGIRVGKTAPRRFSEHELVDIVTRARSRGLDAPGHLVRLISDLNAFAEYATQRLTETDTPDDYERLREEVSHARAQIERALAATLEAQSAMA